MDKVIDLENFKLIKESTKAVDGIEFIILQIINSNLPEKEKEDILNQIMDELNKANTMLENKDED